LISDWVIRAGRLVMAVLSFELLRRVLSEAKGAIHLGSPRVL
jgi:hypothetical protein